MSYCVHCGVELENSEEKCPLCGTVVLDPAEPERTHGVPRPYSGRIERLNARINRQFAAIFISVFMFFAAVICLVINFITEHQLSWSQYVVSSVFLAWVLFTGPLLFRKRVVLKSILSDAAALVLFLLMIQNSEGIAVWFYSVAIPLIALVVSFFVMIELGVRAKLLRGLALASVVVLCTAVFCVVTEVLTDLYLRSTVELGWSLFVLVPCLGVICLLLLLRQKRRLNAEVKKRLHF